MKANKNQQGAAVDKSAAAPAGVKVLTLPSGKVAHVQPFKGKHIREAQKVAGEEIGMFIFALIASLVTIEGNKIVAEDLDDMDGRDVLALQKEFTDANF